MSEIAPVDLASLKAEWMEIQKWKREADAPYQERIDAAQKNLDALKIVPSDSWLSRQFKRAGSVFNSERDVTDNMAHFLRHNDKEFRDKALKLFEKLKEACIAAPGGDTALKERYEGLNALNATVIAAYKIVNGAMWESDHAADMAFGNTLAGNSLLFSLEAHSSASTAADGVTASNRALRIVAEHVKKFSGEFELTQVNDAAAPDIGLVADAVNAQLGTIASFYNMGALADMTYDLGRARNMLYQLHLKIFEEGNVIGRQAIETVSKTAPEVSAFAAELRSQASPPQNTPPKSPQSPMRSP